MVPNKQSAVLTDNADLPVGPSDHNKFRTTKTEITALTDTAITKMIKQILKY